MCRPTIIATISIHSPRARGDRSWRWPRKRLPISIHSPRARGDLGGQNRTPRPDDFNPLPSCEGRQTKMVYPDPAHEFQSTPLVRGETSATIGRPSRDAYFNPLPSCEGRRRRLSADHQGTLISIHSPHARGDCAARIDRRPPRHFNPLPSCEGRLRAAV